MKKKRIFIYSLNIIQLVVFFLVFICNVGVSNYYKEIYNKINGILFTDRTMVYEGISTEVMDLDSNNYDISSIKDKINSFIKNNQINSFLVLNSNKGEGFISNNKSEGFDTIMVYKEYLSRYPLEVALGRNFTEKELQGVESINIPIIIGYNLKDQYKIGEIIEVPVPKNSEIKDDKIITKVEDNKIISPNFKYEVIGIAKPNTMIRFGSQLPYDVEYSDNIIYSVGKKQTVSIYSNDILVSELQINEIKELYGLKGGQGTYLIECSSKEVYKGIKDKLNEELKKNKISGHFIDIEDNSSLKAEYKKIYMFTSILGAILSVFVLTGLICTLLYTLEGRKKEFGVLIALGLTKRKIQFKNIRITFTIVTLGLVIALGISYIIREILLKSDFWREDNFFNNLFLIDKALLSNLIIIQLILIFICSLPILLKIKKYTVIELIRGK